MHITLDLALTAIRELEPKLAEIGYHSALTGGVLYRGSSEKDIDVVIYPHDPAVTVGEHILKELFDKAGFVARYKTDARYVNRRVWIYGKDDVCFDFFIS